MIINKKYKERIKQLENTIEMLKNEHLKNVYKDDLLQVIKAIINKFEEKEITISIEEIERAKQYDIYVTDDIMKFAKKYQLINSKELLRSYKE